MAVVEFGSNPIKKTPAQKIDQQRILAARSLALAECASLKQLIDVISLDAGGYAVCEMTGLADAMIRSTEASIAYIGTLLDGKTPEQLTEEQAVSERAKLFTGLFAKLDSM